MFKRFKKSKIDNVYSEILPEMARNQIPDTPLNRISCLMGLRDGWLEDDGDNPDATPWIEAVTTEIDTLIARHGDPSK